MFELIPSPFRLESLTTQVYPYHGLATKSGYEYFVGLPR